MSRKNIIVAGAGPAGLSFARALSNSTHHVEVIERQPLEALSAPTPDGREIALTLRSQSILQKLGVWQSFPADEIHPLMEAWVRNGSSPFAMAIGPDKRDALGHLVSNHIIRKSLFDAVSVQDNVTLRTGRAVTGASNDRRGVSVTLDDGTVLSGDLLVAADSRFSDMRDKLGIGASVTRFGHTMMVCRISHSLPHRGISTEWFDRGRTIALLPLREGMSGLVVTMGDDEARRICALSEPEIETIFAGYLGAQWGDIRLLSRPCPYPLAMTFAETFAVTRAALIGDTAVGMHPVTAHGFNFGLLGAWRLAQLVGQATDPGAPLLLRRYALQHRLATMPLYEATRQLVKLFTDDRPLARPLRSGILRLGALPPVRMVMGRLLSEARAV